MKRSFTCLTIILTVFLAISPSVASVDINANRITYLGTGTYGPFSFPYKFLSSSDLKVTKYDVATYTPTVLVLNTNYTVTGAGVDAGGSVTLLGTPLASGYELVIERSMDFLQPTEFATRSNFTSTNVNNTLDKHTMELQQLLDASKRSAKLLPGITSITDLLLPVPVASYALCWNATATGLTNCLNDGSTPATINLDSIANYASLDAAITALGSNPATLLIDRQVSVTGNTTVPANITLLVIQGGSFTITSGKVLTLNREPDAGSYTIFYGAGTVTFPFPATVHAKWWPNSNNGTGDDTAAVQAALDSLPSNFGAGAVGSGGEIVIAPGAWRYNLRIAKNNVRLSAVNRRTNAVANAWMPYDEDSPVITIGGTDNSTNSAINGVRIDGFVLMQYSANSKYGLWIENGINNRFSDFEIYGFGGYSVKIGSRTTGVHMDTENNIFENFRIYTGSNIAAAPTYGIVGESRVGYSSTMNNVLRDGFIWGPGWTAGDTGASIYSPGEGGFDMYNVTTQTQAVTTYSIHIPDASGYGNQTYFHSHYCYYETPNNAWTNIYYVGDSPPWRVMKGQWGGNGMFVTSNGDSMSLATLSDDINNFAMAYDSFAYRSTIEWYLGFGTWKRDTWNTSAMPRRIGPTGRKNITLANDNGTIVLDADGNSTSVQIPAHATTSLEVGVASGQVGINIIGGTSRYGIYNHAEGGYGMQVDATTGYGVSATVTTGVGISSTASDNGSGVTGGSDSGYGIWGSTTHGRGGTFSTGGNGTALRADGNGTVGPTFVMTGILESNNSTTAQAAGLPVGAVFKTGDTLKIVQ